MAIVQNKEHLKVYACIVRIGVIHSRYRSSVPSGENITVKEISEALESCGHSLSTYLYDSDLIVNSPMSMARRFLQIIFPTKKENKFFSKWVSDQDSVQIHNAFPGLTLGSLKILKNSKVRIVKVIHNYRKSCLSGNHMRKGNACFKCTLNSQASGVLYGCYNGSRLKSLVFMLYNKVLNKFETETVDQFVAISSVVAAYLLNLGISPDRIKTIPNSVPKAKRIGPDANEILFLGRLEPEKGVLNVMELWAKHSHLPVLNIVGSGSLNRKVEENAKKMMNVNFHGYLSGDALERITSRCKVAIFLNKWEEPFGRTFAEALTRGQALIAYDKGIASEFIINELNGFLVKDESEIITAIQKSLEFSWENLNIINEKIWREKFSRQVTDLAWANFYSNIDQKVSNHGLLAKDKNTYEKD